MKNNYEIRGDLTVIFVKCKGEILECLIDTKDLDLVSSIRGTWGASQNTKGRPYVTTRIQKVSDNRWIYLYRMLMEPEKGKIVDHINNNTLDNRRSNLRVLTNAENMQNMSANKGSKSGIRGVHWFRNRWVARMTVNGVDKHLGTFKDKFEAEKVVKEARAKYMPYSQEALAD